MARQLANSKLNPRKGDPMDFATPTGSGAKVRNAATQAALAANGAAMPGTDSLGNAVAGASGISISEKEKARKAIT